MFNVSTMARGFHQTTMGKTQILKSEKLVESGQVVINTAAIPIEKKGKTNMIKVTIVD